MTEISTDVRRARINYVSSSLCSTSAAGNYGSLSHTIVFPSTRHVIGQTPLSPLYQENLQPVVLPRRLDSLSDEMSDSYTKVVNENKDVLMLLAE